MATRKSVNQELVKKEARNLKKNCTKKELKALNFYNLSGRSDTNCLYGQMTGTCVSVRASELINKCCTRVYNRTQSDPAKCPVNGKPKGEVRGVGSITYYSPIEVFIAIDKNKENGNNEKLIDFLKGESTRLNFV